MTKIKTMTPKLDKNDHREEFEFCAMEYSKALALMTCAITHYQIATDKIISLGFFSKDLIGKDREVERAYDRFQIALGKLMSPEKIRQFQNDIDDIYSQIEKIL